MIDDLINIFPDLLASVMVGKKTEADEKNVTDLAVALITNADGTRSPSECVDAALYLYERIQAGLKPKMETIADVIRNAGETRYECNCGLDVYKAPEQHAIDCPERNRRGLQ